ncbi:MAG: hypothetical protein Q9209_001234 [Squamulea sp. 1 TL-2023]
MDADTKPSCKSSILDLPQLYTRPSSASLLSTLEQLSIKPAAWDTIGEASQPDKAGLPRYLTGIVASPLAWIEDENVKEQIWEAASARLSERSGRSAIPSLSRTFVIGTSTADSVSINLHEPSLTADNLGHKTWLASYLLANRFQGLVPHLPSLESSGKVIELGAGTGLVGLAIAAMFDVHVHLTDLPAIVPNLYANVNMSAAGITKGSTSVGALDWSDVLSYHVDDHKGYDIVVAADPLYSPRHPAWLAAAINYVLQRDVTARVVIELPLREAYVPEINELKSRLAALGLVVLVEGVERAFEDWQRGQQGNERTEVECWWAVWQWAPSTWFLRRDNAISNPQ